MSNISIFSRSADFSGIVIFSRVPHKDRFCNLVVRVPGYRSRGPGSILGLLDFLKSSGSGMLATQPR
jgi:hypothetical protein